jgi:hypothetical protein
MVPLKFKVRFARIFFGGCDPSYGFSPSLSRGRLGWGWVSVANVRWTHPHPSPPLEGEGMFLDAEPLTLRMLYVTHARGVPYGFAPSPSRGRLGWGWVSIQFPLNPPYPSPLKGRECSFLLNDIRFVCCTLHVRVVQPYRAAVSSGTAVNKSATKP